jgi:hypothetical protein
MPNGDIPNRHAIHADPTKDFFVRMITRDISLRDCIFDLLDNSMDGAKRNIAFSDSEARLDRFEINISFDRNSFIIKDNCGGISLSDAIEYAFHFGRKSDSPADVKGGIGLYGIGMKRAIFKIGKFAKIVSETASECFSVSIDVDIWEKIPGWDFEYEDASRQSINGVRIEIGNIHQEIGSVLSDPAFRNELITSIAQDYAFFIDKGISIKVCGEIVPDSKYQLKQSEELSPTVEEYTDDGVDVRILAGLIGPLPDEIPDELKPKEAERYGWFVVCNDRIVLTADKTDLTVWGNNDFPVWHPQYYGFAGFVFFRSEDQRKLPWTTTKRNLDAESQLYRRTLTKMKRITKEFIAYTNRRKSDLETAKTAENKANTVNILLLDRPKAFSMPKLSENTPKEDEVTISYRKRRREVEEIKTHLENPTMTAKDVGKHTFDYFQKMELGK